MRNVQTASTIVVQLYASVYFLSTTICVRSWSVANIAAYFFLLVLQCELFVLLVLPSACNTLFDTQLEWYHSRVAISYQVLFGNSQSSTKVGK